MQSIGSRFPARRAHGARAVPALVAMLAILTAVAAPGTARAQAAGETPALATAGPDVGWPREVKDGQNTITVYQPQVESWDGNLLESRSAVSVSTPAAPTPTFGVVWFTARTDVDKQTRTVTLQDLDITRASFPTQPAQQGAYLQALRAAVPQGARTIALDRIEANLAVTAATQGGSSGVRVKNEPPRIIVSEKPAILVLVDGKPALRQVDGSPDLLRVINTRALLLLDQSSGTYYLYTMNRWASASSLDGTWSAVASPPAGLDAAKEAATKAGHVDLLSDPPGAAKKELEQGILPVLYVSTGPAELLQTDGPPDFQPVGGTSLLDVTNTTGDIFMDTSNQTYYVLVSGRWFSGPSLTAGPWTFVDAKDLPADFAKIPFSHPKGTVLTSVSGTPQAKEAAISANVPQTATVKRSEAKMPPPQYDGQPKFERIDGTSLEYAVNTATPVIETGPGTYFAVVNGVWFTSGSPTGPWVIADRVPPAIYTIPPSSPLYYVTYVRVYGSTPEVVYVGYTPGYYGTYVVPAGTVVYGTGYVYQPWVGSVWIGPPYTYGFGAGFAFGATTGFALGLAAGAFCHPWWGPAGWGWGWGWGHNDVNINRTVNINNVNVYNRWGKNSVVSGDDRYAGRVGNTTFAGNKGGDVYAGRNGNVYRREDGSWQKYDDGNWNDVNRDQAKERAQTTRDDRTQSGELGQQQGARAREAGTGDADRFAGGQRAGGDAGQRFDAGSLDRDWQGRQLGEQRASSWRDGGGGGAGRGGFGGGDRFGGGFRGGFRGGRR